MINKVNEGIITQVILASILLFSFQGYSMSPAPPEIHKFSISGFKIITEPQNVSGKDITKIYKTNLLSKDFLWEFLDYIGHKKYFISNDGLSIALFGNRFFGNTVKDDDETIVLQIFKKDGEKQEFTYKDITNVSILAAIKEHNLPVKGGGWVSIGDILSIQSVDWENKKVKFKQTEVSFK